MTATVDLAALRAEVRGFLGQTPFTPLCDSWVRAVDRDFSRRVGARGWIGMTWPREYGGHAMSNEARWVVTEELLRAGAPVAGHWTADRQIGPTILRVGTEDLRTELLPAICRGDLVFAVGLSETEAGSDLAALRTRAVKVEDGWELTGSKVWTTSAHHATHAYVLARTDTNGSRHQGLTEFIVDMDTPGLQVRPIIDLAGEHHFNEMVFDGVFVPDRRVLGDVGAGWQQVTDQLAFERGGAERYLSTYPLLAAAVRAARRQPDRAATERLGLLSAQLTALRRMGWDVARELDRGSAPIQLAVQLKLLGTQFEQEVVEAARYVFDICPPTAQDLELLRDAVGFAPMTTLRGGTSEIMRTVIARGEVA